MDELLKVLERWEDSCPGLTRIVMVPVDKHTDEPIGDEVRLPLELLVHDAREAAELLVFARVLSRMFER